jgi:hypothetical protein
MNSATLIKYGVIGVGLYALYKWLAPSCKTSGPSVLSTALCNISSGIANSIVNWTTCCAITTSPGINVQFPNGSQVALSSLPQGHDCAGNTYVQYGGASYQLTGSNSCGSYQATAAS